MDQISFADDAIDEVVSGVKFETLRLGEDFSAGSMIRCVTQDGRQIGWLKILEKSEVSFRDLSESDVRSHNSGSLENLKRRLLLFYLNLEPESVLTRYRFQFLRELSEK